MIFCGDACYTFETLERMIIGGFHLDPVRSISALKRIKAMAKQHDAEIFPSHDMGPGTAGSTPRSSTAPEQEEHPA